MAGYNTEEEQVEALKKWWKEKGTSTVLLIAIVLAGWFGWQGWQARQAQAAEAAAQQYQTLLLIANQLSQMPNPGAVDRAADMVAKLKEEHAGSVYTAYSALLLARLKVEQDAIDDAIAELQWILDSEVADNLKQLASIRLARLQFANGDVSGAKTLVESALDGDFAISAGELMGDILLKEGDVEAARAAYKQALSIALVANEPQPFIQMKLDALPPEAGEGEVQ